MVFGPFAAVAVAGALSWLLGWVIRAVAGLVELVAHLLTQQTRERIDADPAIGARCNSDVPHFGAGGRRSHVQISRSYGRS